MNVDTYYYSTNITAHPFENKHVKRLISKIVDKIHRRNGYEYRTNNEIRIVDPFCNNKTTRMQGTKLTTNDLNPEFNANYCMEANDFAELMLEQKQEYDLVLFDPPYSLRQLKELYNGIGKDLELWQTQNMWGRAKNALGQCVKAGGYAITFGWSTSGFGRRRGFEKREIHVLCQQGRDDRYDLLITVEQKPDRSIFEYS